MGYFDDIEWNDEFMDWMEDHMNWLDERFHGLLMEAELYDLGEGDYNCYRDEFRIRDQLYKFLTGELGLSADKIVELDLNDYPVWKSLYDFNKFVSGGENLEDIDVTGTTFPKDKKHPFYEEIRQKWLENVYVTDRFLWNLIHGTRWNYINFEPEEDLEFCYGSDELMDGQLDHMYLGVTKSFMYINEKTQSFFKDDDFKKVNQKHCVYTTEDMCVFPVIVENEEIVYIQIKDFRKLLGNAELGDVPTMLEEAMVMKYRLPIIRR